jgi:hypothetical protein
LQHHLNNEENELLTGFLAGVRDFTNKYFWQWQNKPAVFEAIG